MSSMEEAKKRKPKGWRPVKYGKDFGNGITLGKMVKLMADRIDAGDQEGALGVLDEHFIFGAWGNELSRDNAWDDACRGLSEIRRDIRGLAVAAYKRGLKRGRKQERKKRRKRNEQSHTHGQSGQRS